MKKLFSLAEVFQKKIADEYGPDTERMPSTQRSPESFESGADTDRMPDVEEETPETKPKGWRPEPDPISVHLTAKNQSVLLEALSSLYNQAMQELEEPMKDPAFLNLTQEINIIIDKLQLPRE
ncbi:hypothetical protein LCGC14_0526330 [marine sediment metagenome]|uniref:Uncharacterized protein n=1 Tax=marine sediment metagenome TaxID=412755 RepID=A0A0F9V543_9ZZZZ